MSEYISIKEATKIIDSGALFSCKVVTYDKRRKRGGKIKEIPEGKVSKSDGGTSSDPVTRPPTKLEALKAKKHKAPNHKKNYTRNIRIYQNGHETSLIEKIHPPLLIEFNGKTVLS